MTGPEDKAREQIDRQLEECGWQVTNWNRQLPALLKIRALTWRE